MLKYNLKIELTIDIDGQGAEVFDYEEGGEGPVDDLEETIDMFIAPRLAVDSKLLIKKVKSKFIVK